jgi:hypothetical protein
MNILDLTIFEKKGLERYLSTKLFDVTSDDNGISNKYVGMKVILDLIEQ